MPEGNGLQSKAVHPDRPSQVIKNAQLSLLEEWITSPEALNVAGRILRRRSLNYAPTELIHEAWLRLQRSMAARSEPLPEMSDLTAAARYCSRVLDNLSRDWVRVGLRRRELMMASIDEIEETLPQSFVAGTSDPNELTHTRLLLTQLVHMIAVRADAGWRCSSCSTEIVVAAAIEIVQMALAGTQPNGDGRNWIDQLMYVAIDRVHPDPAVSDAARAQRKSRCGRCVMELLNAAMSDVNGGDLS